MEISRRTQVFCLIGDPVEHSLSPTMHNAAFKHLNLNAVYVAFKVKREELENAIRGIRGLGIRGINVTMPHKSAIINYLDEVDQTVKLVGAVNTLLNDNGKLIGFNTDGIGALRALKENQTDPEGKRILLLGAGGAARAIAFQLAQVAGELRILNRNGEKARQLANLLRKELSRNIVGDQLSPMLIEKWLKDTDILVNCTSVGMHPNADQTLVKRKWLRDELTVMDIVYDPIETRLIRDSKDAGAKVIHGTEMLLFQGAASFEIWWGRPAPIEVMRNAILKKIREREKSL